MDSLAYTTSAVDSTKIKDLQLYSVQFGTNTYIPIKVQMMTSAQKAGVMFRQLTDRLNCHSGNRRSYRNNNFHTCGKYHALANHPCRKHSFLTPPVLSLKLIRQARFTAELSFNLQITEAASFVRVKAL